MKVNRLLLFGLILAVALFTTECNSAVILFPEQGQIVPPATEKPYDPIECSLDIAPVPSINETVELIFKVTINREYIEKNGEWWIGTGFAKKEDLIDSKAWIEVNWRGSDGHYADAKRLHQVPMQSIMFSGNSSWEGNALETDGIELSGKLRLPENGTWLFSGFFTGNNWPSATCRYAFKGFSIAEGITIETTQYGLHSPPPLDYLDYIENRFQAPPPPLSEQNPVSLEIDVAHPPLAKEIITVTCRIVSPFKDMTGFNVDVTAWRRNQDGSISKVLLDRIITSAKPPFVYNDTVQNESGRWQLDLVKNVPLEFTMLISLPEPGEWLIVLQGWGMGNDSLLVTAGENKSYYGWAPKPMTTLTIVTSTAAIESWVSSTQVSATPVSTSIKISKGCSGP